MPSLLISLLLWAFQSGPQLDRADARVLVRNAPRVIELPERCLLFDEASLAGGGSSLLFMVYNKCHKGSGNGLIGPYYVDLLTGQVRVGDPDGEPDKSEALKRARDRLLQRKRPPKGR